MKCARLLYPPLAVALVLVLAACSKDGPVSVDQHFNQVVMEQTSLIERHITDPRKRERLMTQVNELDGVLRRLASDLEVQSDSMDALMHDYSATPQQFEDLSARFNALHDAALDRLREIRNECRRLTTQEEWAKISRRNYTVLGY